MPKEEAYRITLTPEALKKLKGWLMDYAEQLFHSGKAKRLAIKEDIRDARDICEFLTMLPTMEERRNVQS